MNENVKNEMREKLMIAYGLDINEAVMRFSTQNYAFIFPDQPYMIRVSMSPKKSREEIVSELMWVDDLRAFKQTICEPNTSLNGKILEEFEIGGKVYRASMIRTARGNIQVNDNMTPMFFICVGDLLGTIHKVSTDERIMGIHYKRSSTSEIFTKLKESSFNMLDLKTQSRILQIEDALESIPKEPGLYGICHGDFHKNNFFVEANNIWVFDFDSCCYDYYLSDFSTFLLTTLMGGYKAEKDRHLVVEEDILPYFRIGYELNKSCSKQYWDNLPLFLSYRAAVVFMSLMHVHENGLGLNFDTVKKSFEHIMMKEDVLEALNDLNGINYGK